VQCSAVQCSAVQCRVVQCSAVQCNGQSGHFGGGLFAQPPNYFYSGIFDFAKFAFQQCNAA
jgi:hypothetical protein